MRAVKTIQTGVAKRAMITRVMAETSPRAKRGGRQWSSSSSKGTHQSTNMVTATARTVMVTTARATTTGDSNDCDEGDVRDEDNDSNRNNNNKVMMTRTRSMEEGGHH